MLAVAGHTASWGKGYPELLTQCCDEQGVPNGQLGPLNPTRNSTYNALWLLLREAAQMFPDTYLHLGGDEVPFDCWQVCSGTLLFLHFTWCALNMHDKFTMILTTTKTLTSMLTQRGSSCQKWVQSKCLQNWPMTMTRQVVPP